MTPELSACALRQGGVVSRCQARRAGYSERQIRYRVASGEWAVVTPSVLRVAGTPVSERMLQHAALLHVGDGGVLSHATAARRWGFPTAGGPVPVHVTTAHAVRNPVMPLRVHRGTVDFVVYDGLRLTTPLRTAIDVALRLPRAERLHLLDEILRRGIVTLTQLREGAAGARGRQGSSALRRDIELLDPDLQSVLEAQLARALQTSELPVGLPQYAIGDREGLIGRVDRAWPEQRLVVELDGFAWHTASARFREDRRRQNRLTTAGWTVLRFTAHDVSADMPAVLRRIATALRQAA